MGTGVGSQKLLGQHGHSYEVFGCDYLEFSATLHLHYIVPTPVIVEQKMKVFVSATHLVLHLAK